MTLRDFSGSVEEKGCATVPDVLSAAELQQILASLQRHAARRTRAGIRHAMQVEAVASIASDPRVLALATAVLGSGAVPYRATLFDKSNLANWLVVWHQDTALPLQRRLNVQGWGPWSVKDGVLYAHAPARALSQVLALRVHLDDSTETNGPLRVLPGTHNLGVLSDERIEKLVSEIAPVALTVPARGIIAMRPLVVHASSKSQSTSPRRVLHIEYSGVREFDGLQLART